MQYINNTWTSWDKRSGHEEIVKNIYKVQWKGELQAFMEDFGKLHNKRLLFHGTKNCNFMGILSQGLKVNPADADQTGSMFGDGIYFADTFDKSIQYCNDWNFFMHGEVNRFVLVCEVALGTMSEWTDNTKPIK